MAFLIVYLSLIFVGAVVGMFFGAKQAFRYDSGWFENSALAFLGGCIVAVAAAFFPITIILLLVVFLVRLSAKGARKKGK